MSLKYPKRGFLIPTLIFIVVLWAIIRGDGSQPSWELNITPDTLVIVFLLIVILSLILLIVRNIKKQRNDIN